MVLLNVVVYAGSDLSSGMLATQLTFTPQRSAVALVRAFVASLFGGLLMTLGSGVSVLVTFIWFIALRGYENLGNGIHPLTTIAWAGLFGLIIGFAGSLVVTLADGSVGAAVVLLGLLMSNLVVEMLGPAAPGWAWHVLPTRHAEAFVTGRSILAEYTGQLAILRGEAVIFHLIALVVLTVLALVVFERRDVKA